MNGLRFIRTQCNPSLNDIATVLGVSGSCSRCISAGRLYLSDRSGIYPEMCRIDTDAFDSDNK